MTGRERLEKALGLPVAKQRRARIKAAKQAARKRRSDLVKAGLTMASPLGVALACLFLAREVFSER